MIFGQDRNALRKMYRDAWSKAESGETLSPLEQQIATVVAEHPEYHAFLTDDSLDKDFSPEMGMTNPFLHMGLHLAVREQVATNRPPGIRSVFESLASRHGDALEAEHAMIDVLAETLWTAQRYNTQPDEQKYLASLRQL